MTADKLRRALEATKKKAVVSNPDTNIEQAAVTNPIQTISRADDLRGQLEKVKEKSMPKAWIFGQAAKGKKIYVSSEAGTFLAKQKEEQAEKDRLKEELTGHETFGTDIKQAMSGGGKHWLASQLSTGATAALAFEAARHKDNYYEPEVGSNLWKYLGITSARTREANELMENSKAGRGKWTGGLVMDAASQFVENGIDRSLSLIPVVGQVAHTVSFASRSFGGRAQQLREEGKSVGAQIIGGAVSSAVETLTESMWSYGGGLARGVGARMADNSGLLGRLTLRAEAALAKRCGPVLSKLAMAFGTEAIEEMAADVLNPMLGALVEVGTKNTKFGQKLAGDFEAEEWQGFENMFYDGLVGGISGVGGGIVEAANTMTDYKSDYAGNKYIYAAALRQEAEMQKAGSKMARGLSNASILESLDALFSKETGETFSERVSKARSKYVNKSQAYKMLVNTDEDAQRIIREVAKNFAENNFANQVVDKSVLEEAAYKFLVRGEFGEELNGIEGARTQIKNLTKDIMETFAQKKLDDAKSKKDKSSAAFYSNLVSQYVNRNITEESTVSSDDVDVTEARPIRNTMEDIEADRAARDEELHPRQPKPAYVDRVVEQEDNLPFTYGEDYGEEATAPTQSQPVQNDVVEQQNDEVSVSKADTKKIDKLFNGKQKSVIISSDAVLNAIQQRAEAEGKDVVVKERKDGKRVVTLKDKATGNVIVDNQKTAEAQKNIEEAKTEVKEAEGDVKAALEDGNTTDALDFFGELGKLYLENEIETLDKSIEAVEENIDNIQEIIDEGDFTEIPKSEYEFQLKSEQENLEALQSQREELSNRLKELNKTAEQAQKFADDAKAKLEVLEAQLDEVKSASRSGAKATADNVLYETAKQSGEKISDAEFNRKHGNTSDPVVKNITRWLVDNKDVSRFTKTFTENGKTTTIDGEKVIAAAMRYYLVSSEAMQTEGLSQEEAFEKAYEKVIRVMAGDDALFNTNDVDTTELESAIEDLKATIAISEDVAKLATEQAKQLEGEVNGEQVVQNNRGTESGEFSESAESAPSYAKSLDEINAENRPTSRIAEDSNAFGWDRDLWDYLRRGLERLRVLESNSTKFDNTYEQLKNGALDTGRYIYSLTDESGNAVGEVVGADAEEMDEQTASAFVTALKLCEGYDDVVIKVIRGRVYAKSKTGGEAKNVYGMAYIRTDGTYGCFVNSEMKTVQVHEPAHVLYKRLSLSNNLSVADNALNSALTLERKAEINATYFPELSSFEAKEEIFARLANRMQWFTNEEVEAFYNSLLSSGNEDATVYAKRELQIMQPLLGENKLSIDESLYTDNLSNDYSAYEEADNKATLEDGEIESTQSITDNATDTTMTKASEDITNDEDVPSLAEFRKQRGETKKNIYELNEERAINAKDEENLNLADADYYERRRADKDIPSIKDFERQQSEQPKAERKASPSEGWDMAERTFGSGHKRATRVAKAFSKLANPFADVEKYGRKGGHILSKTSDMYERLIDVNDDFGTIKDVADEFATWRDDADMKEYWDEDVAARFQKILEDADNQNWTFDQAQQKAISQAYEEAVNAMMAKINNVNKDSVRLADLRAEAVTNKLGVKHDSFPAKVMQKWLRMQATTDTALKFFGGFKGKGQFYDLAKDIKKSVADRMVNYVDAYSYFDAIKKMDGFQEFANNTKTYALKTDTESFRNKDNPFNGHEFTLQQIVTINRLIDTLDKTFEHSDAKLADRIKGFVVRDAKGNSFTVNFEGTPMQTLNGLVDIQKACRDILNRDGDVFKVAREYSKACDKMFAALGKKVSATKKALTGNGLSLIGEAYTPVLWANEDGTPADFNFSDDDRIKPPSFLYQRTAKQGHLVVSDISYIVDKYIEKASDYAATAQIKDTLARLKDGSSLIDNGKGLDSALAESFGKDAGAWFDEYVKDLTQYSDSDSIFAELRKRMQRGALIGSPSVMMKQISSYWSAMGILSPEALHMAYRWKLGTKALDNSEYNKLIKYRGLSGNIDPTLSEVMKGVAQYGNVANSRVFQLFTNGISQQDFKTVDNLYTATMIDTYLKNQDKGVEYFTSGEFQNDIDSKFAEVMMRSQPTFDTELRAEYARTDNEFIKMLSMFRTQQTQNFNLIATAVGEYNAAKGTEAQGEKAEVLRQTVRGQLQAAISLSLLSVAADFLLHGLKKYRGDGDDEDEKPGDGKIELGRILGRIGINTLEAGSSTGWGLDYLTKWLIDKMSGGETSEFYGVNFGPLTTMKNVVDNLEYVVRSPTRSNVKNVAVNIAQLLGCPLNNAYRIVNSAIMWTAEATGNPEHFDDALKMWDASTKMNKKNEKGRNLLVESGLSKGEAKAFIKEIDVNGDGLSKDELSEYYISNPEEAEAVGILWDSMGWKQSFEKAKPSLDKKVKYNSNPLYAEMDADENESVTKTELMDYYIEHPELRNELETLYTDMGWKNFAAAAKSADKKIVFRSNPLYAEMDEDESESVSKSELVDYYLEHPDMYDTLSSLYKELGFSGTFRSAIRSAESTKLKETAEDAFYDNDYNALFESVSQMKNGKTWLTNMVKDEYPEYENTDNPLLRYITNSGMSTREIDAAVESVGGKDLVPKYKKLRDAGLSPKQAVEKLDVFDANDNGSITQAELADYYKAHPEDEALVAEFWSACGWTKSWAQYKKSKKIK